MFLSLNDDFAVCLNFNFYESLSTADTTGFDLLNFITFTF